MLSPIIRRRRRRLGILTTADRLLMAFMVVGASAGLVALAFSPAGSGAIIIRGEGGFEETVAAGGSGTFVVPGPVGETVVVVEDGVAHVESSDCRHQICVNMGRIRAPGELIACVPNGVTVVIEGRSEDGPDAVTR